MWFFCANTLHNNWRWVDCKILCLKTKKKAQKALKKTSLQKEVGKDEANIKWEIIENECIFIDCSPFLSTLMRCCSVAVAVVLNQFFSRSFWLKYWLAFYIRMDTCRDILCIKYLCIILNGDRETQWTWACSCLFNVCLSCTISKCFCSNGIQSIHITDVWVFYWSFHCMQTICT